jgi:hypothetical protein
MQSKVLSHVGARELVRRGPLVIQGPQAAAALNQLGQMGIGLDAVVDAMDSALVGPAIGSLGTPAQFLQNWLPGIVRQVTRVRNIDELIGVSVIGSWEDEEVVQTASELTGKAELYGDASNIPLANYNPTYERRSVIRFEQGLLVGRLEEARAAKANLNMAVEKRAAAALSLDIARNRVGFFGFNSPDTRVFGFLNDPNLPGYVSVPSGATDTEWSTKDFLEITADIRLFHVNLVNNSGGNIKVGPGGDAITMAMPLGFSQYMGVTSEFGNSVGEWMATTYPTTRYVESPELTGANGGANVIYIYAEDVDDGSTDDGRVFIQIVPARFQALGTEQRAKSYVEDYTNALAGVMVKRPWAVGRYTGV